MIGLLLDWLEAKALSYLRWCDERRWEVEAICPDCGAPESDCICAANATQQRMCEDAFDIGYERAMEGRR